MESCTLNCWWQVFSIKNVVDRPFCIVIIFELESVPKIVLSTKSKSCSHFCRQNGNVTNISVVSNNDSLTEQKSNKKLEKCIPNVIQSFRIPDKNLSLIFKWPAILTDRVILYSYLCILFKNYWISLSLFLIKKFLSLNEYFLASIRVPRTAQSIFGAFFVRASFLIFIYFAIIKEVNMSKSHDKPSGVIWGQTCTSGLFSELSHLFHYSR